MMLALGNAFVSQPTSSPLKCKGVGGRGKEGVRGKKKGGRGEGGGRAGEGGGSGGKREEVHRSTRSPLKRKGGGGRGKEGVREIGRAHV